MPFTFGAVESLDSVPAEFRYAYSKTANAEGKFEVAAEAKPFVTAYQGVNTALESERGKVRSLNTENANRRGALKPFEDMASELGLTVENDDVAGAIKTHVTTLTDKVKGGEAFKGNLKAIQEAADRKILEQKTAHDKELGAMQGTLAEYLIDREALAALSKNKAKNGGRVLLPHVQSKLKVVKDESGKYTVRAVDDAGNVRYNSAAQPMGVEDIVTEIKTSPDYAFAFESEVSSGLGTRPGAGQRPAPVKPAAGAELSSTQKIQQGLDQLTKAG